MFLKTNFDFTVVIKDVELHKDISVVVVPTVNKELATITAILFQDS